ncbi:RICIN domain-containing protein [Streptomyces sp. 4F14]|uniref:RICIN domain-containing protein n=1 Tax=Streptomyces sp. 4F14 TaxID=3394380 RepID=UPI003A88BA23
MNPVRTVLPALVALAVTALGASASAGAQVRAEETYRNVHSGLCMDDSDGGGLRGYQCNGNNHQKWVVTRHTDDARQFSNMATGRCLDDSAAGLRTWPCNGLDFQKWKLQRSDGRLMFRNVSTGACVADPGEGRRLIALPCASGSANQQWQ